MATIFTKIINREIPSYTIAETEHCYAFLDINPVQKGHCLVVPKVEIDYIYDLEDDILSELMLFSKKVAIAIKNVVDCNRISVAVIGLEVPHAHIHLIPIVTMSDINFSDKKQFSKDVFMQLANDISEQYTKINP